MKSFVPVLKAELIKAFKNGWLVACVVAGCGIAVYDALTYVPEKARWLTAAPVSYLEKAPLHSASSCYCHNLLTSGFSVGSELFFFLAPLLVALAYSWSLQEETKCGYTNIMLTRVSRETYMSAKYVATFIAGGVVVAVPLLFSLVLTACQLPAYMPDVVDEMYIFMNFTAMLGELFWSHPLLYMFARIGVDFVFAGIWACFVLALSMLIRNRVALIAIPFLGLIVIKTVSGNIYGAFGILGPQLTLLDQLRGCSLAVLNYTWVTLLEMGLLFAVTLALPYCLRKRDVL